MKVKFLIFSNIFCFSLYSQIGTYKLIELDSHESIELRKDSFIYEYSAGLIHGIVYGTISFSNDTIILNSDIQPNYSVIASFDDEVGEDKILFEVNKVNFPNKYGFRIHKGRDYDDLDFRNDEKISEHYDTTSKTTKFIIPRNSLNRHKKLSFILYRTNLRIHFDWRNTKINSYTILFNDLPEMVDYEFFTNRKAILRNEGLIFLDKKNKPEKDYYIIKRKRMIKVSKRKRVRIFRKSA